MGKKRFRARKVFISYRRDGGQAHAVNFHNGLKQVLGEDRAFLDVSRRAMEAGTSWRTTVRETLAQCDSLVLVLDPGMADCLREADNAVRFELETALRLGLRVVPVRVDNAVVPGAGELPESLAAFPDLHSPEVHRDAVIADVDRIIEWLTGIMPGEVDPVDRWDLAIVAGLAALGIVAWLTWANELFSVGETWLWAAALALPWILWMLMRRWLFAKGERRSAANRRQTLAWLVVLVVFATGWSVSWSAVYSLPEFEDQAGVLVSRFDGDPRGAAQSALLGYFKSNLQTTDDVQVPVIALPLPRRVGFAARTHPWSREDTGHDQARDFGRSSGAAAVVWGAVSDTETTPMAVRANLTFVGIRAAFQVSESDVVGFVQLREIDDIDSNLAVLGETLPQFLDGYRAFFNATDESGMEFAQTKLLEALDSVDTRLDNGIEDIKSDTVLRDIRASVLFYLGNTDLALERDASAAERFGQSMRETERIIGGRPQTRYIHAANNLGWTHIKAGRFDDAIATFDTTEFECRENDALVACAYVWYNRGDAEARLQNYANAEAQFERAVQRIEGRQIDESDWNLHAQAHQYRAYTLVRLAAEAAGPDKADLLQRAETSWQSGAGIYETQGLIMPEHHRITVARILIERGEWQAAIDLLSALDVPQHRVTVASLLAASYACTGQVDRQFASIDEVTKAIDIQTPAAEAFDEMARIEANCR